MGSVVPSVLSALNELEEKSDVLRGKLKTYDDETLKLIFVGLEGASAVAWQLQADIVAEFQRRSVYGSNAVNQIAKFLEIDERRAWELAQIEEEYFTKKPALRDSPLKKTHYIAALRARRRGKDPVEVVEYALDNNLGPRQLQRYIDNLDSAGVRIIYYKMEIQNPPGAWLPPDPIQLRYLSPVARIVEIKKQKFLEVKE